MLIPRKSLGQNFLLNRGIMEKIRGSLSLQKEDILLEIGAGPGNLTQFLAPYISKLYAIEIDERFKGELMKVVEKYSNIEIIFGDFLEIPIEGDLLKASKATGNLPYNVGTPILRRIIYETSIDLGVFMFASGTAQRFLASEGSRDYSSGTIFVKSFFEVEKVTSVARGSFFPKPKVDSIVLKFRRIQGKDKEFLKGFNQFVKELFSYRRKTIQNSLLKVISSKEKAETLLKELKIDSALRVEMLGMDSLMSLYKSFLREI